MTGVIAIGQEIAYYDVIKTHNGFTFQGQIVEWDKEKKIVLLTDQGVRMQFAAGEIKKIKQKPRKPEAGLAKPYNFQEEGFYHLFNLGISSGPDAGISVTHAIGLQLNRWLGIGVGAGYENYELDEGKRIIPVFAEARGYALKENISPYYAVRVGYGFALTNPEQFWTDADGGFLFNPEIGYRFGASSTMNFTIGLGAKLQNATFTREWEWSDEINVDVLKYRRFEVKFGAIF